jgi:glyoxylase-like metal-dependent hydrolase (beta-lactamase superfamily II)
VTRTVLDARNPGPMTGAGNHTYLLASNGRAVLIDAGVGAAGHLIALERALIEQQADLQTVVVTHGHADHVAGVVPIGNAHPKTVFAKCPWQGDEAHHGIEWRPLRDGDRIPVGDAELRVVYTPGHSADHVALWHEPTRAVYTGDLVIAGSSVMIDASRGGSLTQYCASLERILALEPLELLPAHGPRIDNPGAVVRSHLEHRHARERQVIAALEAGHQTVEAIAESIYHGLEPGLRPAARENVRAHLEKLKADGIAAGADNDESGWRLAT